MNNGAFHTNISIALNTIQTSPLFQHWRHRDRHLHMDSISGTVDAIYMLTLKLAARGRISFRSVQRVIGG